MKTKSWIFLLLVSTTANALSLQDYLTQVKTSNPDARSLVSGIEALTLQNDDEVLTLTEAYGSYGLLDDRKETPQPVFMGDRTRATTWRLGLRKTFSTGTNADIYFDSRRSNIGGADRKAVSTADVMDAKLGLEIRQPLWRNGFGAGLRAEAQEKKAKAETALMKTKFQLKQLLLSAENSYWGVVSMNEIIRLQEENVDRSKRQHDLMQKKMRLRLVDDVDALQVQAALETRRLELQTSLDERQTLLRQMNTLRGRAADDAVDSLSTWSTADILKSPRAPGKKLTREDFAAKVKEALAERAAALQGRSKLRPQLDLVGNYISNGRDQSTSEAYSEIQKYAHHTWYLGIQFSVPIDYSLVSQAKTSFRALQMAAEEKQTGAEYSLGREVANLDLQFNEARGRLERATSLEQIQTDLVQRERRRLSSGRTTTFQAITMEQNLAAAQVQRVRAQLLLRQIHNQLKTFEEQP
jgi:outer membrane protein TolC